MLLKTQTNTLRSLLGILKKIIFTAENQSTFLKENQISRKSDRVLNLILS